MEMNVSPDNRGAVEIPSAIFAMGGESRGKKLGLQFHVGFNFPPGIRTAETKICPGPGKVGPLSPHTYFHRDSASIHPVSLRGIFRFCGRELSFSRLRGRKCLTPPELFSLTRPFIGAQKSKVRGSNAPVKATAAAIKAGLYVPTFKVSSRREISHLKRVQEGLFRSRIARSTSTFLKSV